MPEEELIPQQVETRYCVRWYRSIKDPTKEIVVVYDKNIQKVVYRGKSNDRHDHYKHIQKYYGKLNCDPPKEVHPRAYEGL